MYSLTYVEIDVETFTIQSPEAMETFRFAVPTDYLPTDIDAIPSIDQVTFNPARISLGEDLGERASLQVTFADHRHIFAGEPFTQGTFWGKWRGRYGTRLRGSAIRLIRGTLGQTIDQMDTRHYIVEAVNGPTPEGYYTISAKDVLKFADEDRSQAPILSNGSLAGSVASGASVAYLTPTGIGDAEYPASGFACLGGKEVVEFTRVSDTLTLTARGSVGTIAQAHEAGDRVQLVLRYDGDDAADIIYDLLTNYTPTDADYINLTDWQTETATYLGVIYARTIVAPTSVRQLISELIQQAALSLWWDDRARKIRLNVLREIATDTALFDENKIIAGSLQVKEQPEKRISQIWTYYGTRDPTDSAGQEDNFRAVLADVDIDREISYGSAEIKKVLAAWVETETAATRMNSLQISRFRDPPREFEFDLDRSESVTPVVGYVLNWWGSQDETGLPVNVPIQIKQVAIHADHVHVVAEEMLASGVVLLTNVVLLRTPGAGQWEVPATWNNANNTIAAIGAGGGGYRGNGEDGGRGGGGGAYSAKMNVSLTPGAFKDYYVGTGGLGGKTTNPADSTDGEDTFFGAVTFGASNVAAEGGGGGHGRVTGGGGGLAANGIGDVKYSGGEGGTGAPRGDSLAAGGGGGGAGGPHGDGADGGMATSTGQNAGTGGGGADGGFDGAVLPQPGDGGDNRFSFGGGNSTQPNGDEGGGGRGGGVGSDATPGGNGGDGEQIWTQTVSPIVSGGPGGGGGGGGHQNIGGNGGKYGGGGGGSYLADAGDGGDGLIVISWQEA